MGGKVYKIQEKTRSCVPYILNSALAKWKIPGNCTFSGGQILMWVLFKIFEIAFFWKCFMCTFLRKVIKLGGMPPNLLLSCDFFLSFFLLTICFFSRMLNWISTKLGQNDQWVSGYKSYQQFDLKGHVGVTGVKKVNHVKNMKTALISKLIMSSCRQQTKLQKSQWWPCHTTPHIGVKGQNVSYFQFF